MGQRRQVFQSGHCLWLVGACWQLVVWIIMLEEKLREEIDKFQDWDVESGEGRRDTWEGAVREYKSGG